MAQENQNQVQTEDKISRFQSWLLENGGYIHPDVRFQPVSSGFNVVATQTIPTDTPVVVCPFSLAITPDVARKALAAVFRVEKTSSTFASWSERQLINVYLCMHDILDGSNLDRSPPPELAHRPYVDMLPAPDKLRTSLHFTPEELELFRGTNLYGATYDRQKEWETEWEMCRTSIAETNSYLAHCFTWERYLAAATYLSSRAFPSTLLAEKPSLVSTPSSYPVLLPGVDSLNHARAHPISWVVTSPSSSTPDLSIALVPHVPTEQGHELLNNYGPKPNAELIMGYGFSLPHNPDDTIVLKIGGVKRVNPRWEVGRDARGAEPVWEAVMDAVRAQNRHEGDGEDGGQGMDATEDALWATEVLTEMAEDLLGRLPPDSSVILNGAEAPVVRQEVAEMLDHYVEGQRDILHALIEFAKRKEQSILEEARKMGITIVEDEGEDEESN